MWHFIRRHHDVIQKAADFFVTVGQHTQTPCVGQIDNMAIWGIFARLFDPEQQQALHALSSSKALTRGRWRSAWQEISPWGRDRL
jgi:hypothetical protein